MFLLSSDLSLLINNDFLQCDWTSLFSGMWNEKSTYLALWFSNKIWSIMEVFLGFLTRFCVRGVIPRCSNPTVKQKDLSQFFYNKLCCIATVTGQKMKFCIRDFFSKCDQIRSFLRICSHLLKKSLMAYFPFCAVCTRIVNK